jgi:Ni/Fe-hydrogenase 1 B-type cytochrome subunit
MNGQTDTNNEHKLVYVWQLPVRFYHWLNAASIVVLAATGYLIGNPPALVNSAEASFSFWFGTIRFTHFVAAFIFFFNFLFRLYWGFVGNRFSRWDNFILLKKRQWKEVVDVLKVDIMQISNKPLDSIGHNSLASLTYFFTFLAFLVQSITGFSLYAAMSDSWFPKLFAWIGPILGGDLVTRQVHHLFMWIFIIFAIIHIYLVFYHDYVERRGVTSSMIGGWKFVEDSVTKNEKTS